MDTIVIRGGRPLEGEVTVSGSKNAALPLLFAGLAVAGVTVPAPARDAFDRVGIELPNQPSTNSSSVSDESPAGSTAKSALEIAICSRISLARLIASPSSLGPM